MVCTPVIPSLGRGRQQDCGEFEVSLGYVVNPVDSSLGCVWRPHLKNKHTAKIRKSGGTFPLRQPSGKRSLTNVFRKFSTHAVRENSVVHFGNDQASAMPSTK